MLRSIVATLQTPRAKARRQALPAGTIDIRNAWYFQHEPLFKEAMKGPAAVYTPFESQCDTTSCGKATAKNVVHSMGEAAPDQETMLTLPGCPVSDERVRKQGMTLPQCADLIRWATKGRIETETVQDGRAFERASCIDVGKHQGRP